MSENQNDPTSAPGGIEAIDPARSRLELESLRDERLARLESLERVGAEPLEVARLRLDLAENLNGLGDYAAAWEQARQAFDVFLAAEAWQEAAETCDVLYQAEQPDSIAALGMGVWLGVTYPIDPSTSVALLQHVVEETPANSDGGAVAAVAAHYLADLRGGESRDSLMFFTSQLIAQVARRHRNIEGAEQIKLWMDVLELNDPDVFLPRLAQVVDAIVGDRWWFDRDALRARLPVN